ncbi:hypothetical protein Tco_1189128, partial [Tanacetum coccineum]
YVTQVRLAKRLTKDSYNDLFDYLSQYEKLVNASRAKKLEKPHDPLALVAHTGSSSRIPSPYYVTHPSSVVDYDDDYQGDAFQNNSEDPLTSAIINHAIVQADRVNIQNRNSRNDGRNTRCSYVQEEIIEGNNVQNDAWNTQRTLRNMSSGSTTNVQCYSCSEKDNQEQKYPKQPKIINDTIDNDQIDCNIIFDEPNVDVNNGSVEYDNNVQASYELEQLARKAYKEAENQQINANKVKQQNKVLTQ